jgi:hypothetical protein
MPVHADFYKRELMSREERGYEKAGRCSIFNKVNLLLMIKGPSSSENHASSLLGQAKGLLG